MQYKEPLVRLPQGLTATPAFDGAVRKRSSGVLTQEEIALRRSRGVLLAYDPVQIGWVPADCEDDIDTSPETGVRAETGQDFRPRSLAPTYRFRPWSLADLPVYRTLLDDPAVWAMMYEAYPNPLDEDMARHLIELSSGSEHHEVLAVLRNSEVVGQVRMLFEGDSAELSYWFGRAHWGQGLGSAVVAIYSGRTFAKYPGLRRMFAVVQPDNTASRQVLRKAGFVEHGPDRRRPGWVSYVLTRAKAEAISSGSDRP